MDHTVLAAASDKDRPNTVLKKPILPILSAIPASFEGNLPLGHAKSAWNPAELDAKSAGVRGTDVSIGQAQLT
jgi:hypothetical protein